MATFDYAAFYRYLQEQLESGDLQHTKPLPLAMMVLRHGVRIYSRPERPHTLSIPPLELLQEEEVERHSHVASYVKSLSEAGVKKSSIKLKSYAKLKLLLPHVGLIILSIAYTLLGAVIFYYIEYPHEQESKSTSIRSVRWTRQQAIATLHLIGCQANASNVEFERAAIKAVDNVLEVAYKAYQEKLTLHEIQTDEMHMQWTFSSSLFFAATLITTIGYGHLVPQTATGRVACVIYASFGIPLLLVTVADVGKFLSEWLLVLYFRIRRACSDCGHFIYACAARCCECCRTIPPPPSASASDFLLQRGDSIVASGAGVANAFTGGDALRPSISRASQVKSISMRSHSHAAVGGGSVAAKSSHKNQKFVSALPTNTGVPLPVILGILFGYTAFGAVLLQVWEDWGFFSSFYYSFITVTTIGFGDIVPQNESFLVVTLLYIVIGLIITTMCIDLVGSQYIRRLHYFGRNIDRARQALTMVGDKVVHVRDVIRCLSTFQKRYGLNPDQMERAANLSDDCILDCLITGKPLPVAVKNVLVRPFVPQDIHLMRYIDQRTPSRSLSTNERMLASLESLDLTSTTRCSTCRTPRELAEYWLFWKKEQTDFANGSISSSASNTFRQTSLFS